MYTQLLRHSVIGDCGDEDKEELLERFRHVVGSIVLLSDPLTASSLAKLLHKDPWEVEVTLDSLGSVLDISESQGCGIRSLHPSFCDFLLDQKRCLDLEFWINEQKTHGDLFLSCLKLMSKCLRRDMCILRLPGALTSELQNSVVESSLPLDIQYACRYFVNHLQNSKTGLRDNDNVHTFLREHFLQ